MSNSGRKNFGSLEPEKPPRSVVSEGPIVAIYELEMLSSSGLPFFLSMPTVALSEMFIIPVSHQGHWDHIDTEVINSDIIEERKSKAPRDLQTWSNILRVSSFWAEVSSIELEIRPDDRMLLVSLSVDLSRFVAHPMDRLKFSRVKISSEWGVVPGGSHIEVLPKKDNERMMVCIFVSRYRLRKIVYPGAEELEEEQDVRYSSRRSSRALVRVSPPSLSQSFRNVLKLGSRGSSHLHER